MNRRDLIVFTALASLPGLAQAAPAAEPIPRAASHADLLTPIGDARARLAAADAARLLRPAPAQLILADWRHHHHHHHHHYHHHHHLYPYGYGPLAVAPYAAPAYGYYPYARPWRPHRVRRHRIWYHRDVWY